MCFVSLHGSYKTQRKSHQKRKTKQKMQCNENHFLLYGNIRESGSLVCGPNLNMFIKVQTPQNSDENL